VPREGPVSRVVCGLQPVREAIRAHGAALERVLVESAKDAPQLERLARFASDAGAKVERVRRGELDRLARGARHQGALALAPELGLVALNALDLGPNALVVALDELEDPQNFGAIIRSAVAFGTTAIVWPEHHSAPLSAATFRASAGAVEHAVLCRVRALPDALAALRTAGLAILGLDSGADRAISDVVLTRPIALVVGAEGKGLRKTVKGACDELARLPMQGPLASLNASVALAIALYEVTRQRMGAPS
jgi:23S rRNA (guanosine2251-2'-O)-methyltransferase